MTPLQLEYKGQFIDPFLGSNQFAPMYYLVMDMLQILVELLIKGECNVSDEVYILLDYDDTVTPKQPVMVFEIILRFND